jgi:mannonate dehydratase
MTTSQIKLSMKMNSRPTDDELQFARQLGLDYMYTWVGDDQCDSDSLARLRDQVEAAGLKLWNVGNMSVAKSDKIHLGLPGRDEVIEQFAQFITTIARIGVRYTTFTWEPTQVWSSEPADSRGARARYVNLAEMRQRPLTHEREWALDELWENFSYFIDAILPVAEAAGVHLSLHPNDPPTDSLGGIPCLINSFERYQKAYRLANDSPYLGMEFCTGCWLEGGDKFGDMFEAIQHFTERKKIFIVHFRNVTAPLPEFTETFLDNGYGDMYEAMKTFIASGYDGSMHLDHTPHFVGDVDDRAGTAYAIAYMRALIARAEAELS